MRTHIDWLTFTFTPNYSEGVDEGYHSALSSGLNDLFGVQLTSQAFGGNWGLKAHGRAPYTDAWQLGDSGITLFASPNLTHACVELSGAGCEHLINLGALNEVLTKCCERVTRIDIATDIETLTTPIEFTTKLNHERMRSCGYQKSESGETCYIGSQKSDRYARVYRYNAPHPRSHLLRIEHVFRRQYAKSVALACVNANVESIETAAGRIFGWNHLLWKPSDVEYVDISITSAERKANGTIFWLIKSCAPAFKRLCADGTIRDPQQFFNSYFQP